MAEIATKAFETSKVFLPFLIFSSLSKAKEVLWLF
jgi:hypothetical protein